MSNISWKKLLLLLPLLLAAAPLVIRTAALQEFALYVLVYGLLAMSLNLLVGRTGLVSFGHALFFALGAYLFVALLARGVGLTVSLLAATILCGAAALAIGSVCVRLHDAYFSFITLAFAMLFVNLLDVASAWTGGDAGLTLNMAGLTFLGVNVSRGNARYAFVFGAFLVSVAALFWIVHSSFGTSLRLVRDNAHRAECLGINVYSVKLVAFSVAGLFGGVSGALATLIVSGAYPTFAGWATSGDAIFAILLGGARIFWGPFVGAGVLRMLIDFTTTYSGHTGLVLGALILAIVLGLRQSPLDFAWQWWLKRSVQARRQPVTHPTARMPAGSSEGQKHA